MTDSSCCPVETITTFYGNYTSIKINFLKQEITSGKEKTLHFMYLVSHIPKTHHSNYIKGIFLKHINAQDDNEGQYHKILESWSQ